MVVWFSLEVMFDSCNPMDCNLPGSSVHGISQSNKDGFGMILKNGAGSDKRLSCCLLSQGQLQMPRIHLCRVAQWGQKRNLTSPLMKTVTDGTQAWVGRTWAYPQLSVTVAWAVGLEGSGGNGQQPGDAVGRAWLRGPLNSMPSNHLILYHPLLLLPSIFPSIRVFSNESALHIRWPKYWSFSLNISPSSEYSGIIQYSVDFL